jgi:hypothetical protein
MSGPINNPAELADAFNLLTCEETRVCKLRQQNVDRVLVSQHDKQIQGLPQQEQPTFGQSSDLEFHSLNQGFNNPVDNLDQKFDNLNLGFDNLDNLENIERLKNLEVRMQT